MIQRWWMFLLSGLAFGVIGVRSEISSWFRIYEMFHFQSFHMFGVIGSAVAVGAVSLALVRKYQLKTLGQEPVAVQGRDPGFWNYALGGLIFGLGWGLVGACPGPIYALLGSGYFGVVVLFFGAWLGTYVYGVVKSRLPH